MARVLSIQAEDDARLEIVKKRLGLPSKVEVIRQGLRALEAEIDKTDRIKQWVRAVSLVNEESQKVGREFQKHSRLKRL